LYNDQNNYKYYQKFYYCQKWEDQLKKTFRVLYFPVYYSYYK